MIPLLFNSISLKADCDDGTVVISGKPEYSPISWNAENQLTGLAYPTMKEIIKQINQQKNLNLTLEITPPLPWKRAVIMAEQGHIDMLVGIRKTPNRAKHLTFISPPLIESAQNIFTLKDSHILSREDLVGKTGGIRAGIDLPPVLAMFAKKQNLVFEKVQSTNQNLQKLKLKRLDYVIAPMLPTIHYMREKEIDINLEITPQPLFISKERIAISKKSNCLKYIDQISTQLKALHRNGFIDDEFDKLTQDWDVLDYIKVSR